MTASRTGGCWKPIRRLVIVFSVVSSVCCASRVSNRFYSLLPKLKLGLHTHPFRDSTNADLLTLTLTFWTQNRRQARCLRSFIVRDPSFNHFQLCGKLDRQIDRRNHSLYPLVHSVNIMQNNDILRKPVLLPAHSLTITLTKTRQCQLHWEIFY